MVAQAIERLSHLLETVPPRLKAITGQSFDARPAPGKWSKKEILGHLADSATHNHQRFVRAQFEEAPVIGYDQDQWVANSYYNLADKETLIDFWYTYNRHLLHIIRHIPPGNLQKTCTMKDGAIRTLAFLIQDYVVHLEHHLTQLL
ncbi:DinB family protein [Taibaiella chishuiensis]|uniref:DinB family protein n=1 Tax=Taibaiella chishuiensis TaxID=1434707 RepID=A0A2P8D4V2_9BACT|nr:DinB family protein [Taibaiella chishuiensis]PSK92244.1 DinB family protein [Taibaiella chishuiensis]